MLANQLLKDVPRQLDRQEWRGASLSYFRNSRMSPRAKRDLRTGNLRDASLDVPYQPSPSGLRTVRRTLCAIIFGNSRDGLEADITE